MEPFLFQILTTIDITDGPVFKHRGLSLDTSRNFFSVEAIKRTIDAMAMTKLNVLHWHITDTHSFPMELKSHPEFTQLGAYSPYKIYTAQNIADVVKYARVRGVQIIPEFDQPAHIGEGWQTKSHLLTCLNAQPWQNFCVEPPCGQLDPSKDEVYDILEDIYTDMYEMFDQPSMFHMGGDEISFTCWNQSSEIVSWMEAQGWEGQTEENFMKLWNYFQVSALERFDKISGSQEIPIILWTSHLTEEPYVSQYLDKARYIIQVWVEKDDPDVQVLLELGYNLILTNVDALYMDCGFSGWVADGHNWCSPYKGWHMVYENRPSVIAGPYVSQIWGKRFGQ
jgi:hexosaminidase